GWTAYGASKVAMQGLAACLAHEGDRHNIRANVIAPSAFTNMTKWMLEIPGLDVAANAVGQPVQPVAEVAAYMVSSGFNGYGEIWNVSGGKVRVTRTVESLGVDIPSGEVTAERIAELQGQIRDMAGAQLL